ncbi:uncharacterized protein LOC141613231 [Silene latifolia]|uniref:uncharacterized protein LOC141613231 n=1 Tax=Silene latifolia TaxID=37657 RepID=UPI003D775954
MSGLWDWEREKWLWKRLWNVLVWPRVKRFLWKLCSEDLATRANYATRVRGEKSFCPFCNSVFESSLHLFRDCWVTHIVWEGLSVNHEGEDRGCVREWIEERWRGFGNREHGLFMVGCWALWEHRNKVIFDAVKVDPMAVVRRVRDIVDEMEGGGFVRVKRKGSEECHGDESGNRGWAALVAEYVKVNIDAGVKEGEGVGLGVVYRSGDGRVLWGVSFVQVQEWEPLVDEGVAVLEVVKEAIQK